MDESRVAQLLIVNRIGFLFNKRYSKAENRESFSYSVKEINPYETRVLPSVKRSVLHSLFQNERETHLLPRSRRSLIEPITPPSILSLIANSLCLGKFSNRAIELHILDFWCNSAMDLATTRAWIMT